MNQENHLNNKKIRVLVNGYGVIGKRVADAVVLQDDMELVGVSDISLDYRIKIAQTQNYKIFSSTQESMDTMRAAGVVVDGLLDDALKISDIVVDATPKGIGAKNKVIYDAAGVKSIFQGGESHDFTGVSFVAQANYQDALKKDSVRCVSCNTTGLVRVVNALHSKGLVKKVRATLLRRGTDPWESHKNGLINTVEPEKSIPSHQGPDVMTIIPNLDISTIAVAGPFNLSHLHTVFIELTKEVSKQEIIKIYKDTPRIALIKKSEGVEALNSTIEIMRDIKRPRNDMWEVALWEDILEVSGTELMLVYQVHNEAIVIPENIDAIRALSGTQKEAEKSIQKTDESLGIKKYFY
ncbi:MAG: type II glyceraldehyde-3-phosphate dehydrogenase [bacterium]|nr:type II glyceraldehyde-3-phosphate dehydrogenase [bacterium]